MKSKVFIIDDHELVRRGLRLLINGEIDMEVCGEAGTINEAKKMLEASLSHVPRDVAIVDIGLPDGSGLDLVKYLTKWQPSIKTIILSMYDNEIFAERAINSGAKCYINKQDSADMIIDCIRTLSNNNICVNSGIPERLLKNPSKKHQVSDYTGVSLLTNRELQVYEYIGKGKDTKKIAKLLNLSIKTIETYRANIKQKFQLQNTSELTHCAVLWVMENH